jgi:hypothetical protein
MKPPILTFYGLDAELAAREAMLASLGYKGVEQLPLVAGQYLLHYSTGPAYRDDGYLQVAEHPDRPLHANALALIAALQGRWTGSLDGVVVSVEFRPDRTMTPRNLIDVVFALEGCLGADGVFVMYRGEEVKDPESSYRFVDDTTLELRFPPDSDFPLTLQMKCSVSSKRLKLERLDRTHSGKMVQLSRAN